MVELLTREARLIISEIRKDFDTYNVSATGETAKKFREVVTKNSLKIAGAENLDQVLSGSPPGTRVNISRLENWRKARGVQQPAKSIALRIERIGTRLYRGVDPRYPGKRDRKFVVEEHTTLEKAKAIAEKWASEKRLEIVRTLLNDSN